MQSSSTLTPFSSFLLSLTRPQEQRHIPYVVLMQHSFALTNRIIASEPTKANEQMVYKNAGLDTPKVTCSMDLSGYLWIQKVWKECIDRCDGRVIIVKCVENQSMDDSSRSLVQENGIVIDAYSDPLGWILDKCTQNESTTNHRVIHSTIQLQSILNSIRNAVNVINNSCTDTMKDKLQRPIPILFDSMSPLIINHGIEKLSLFLTAIKQTMKGISPIILPTLNESMVLRDRRILEDHADGLLSLHNGLMTIVKRSVRAGGMMSGGFSIGLRLSKDIQKFELQNGALHLKSSLNHSDRKYFVKKLGADVQEDMKMVPSSDVTASFSSDSTNTNPLLGSSRIILQHEQEDDETVKRNIHQKQQIMKPTIYMQDNDPELEDFDEDEPDDDLDL